MVKTYKIRLDMNDAVRLCDKAVRALLTDKERLAMVVRESISDFNDVASDEIIRRMQPRPDLCDVLDVAAFELQMPDHQVAECHLRVTWFFMWPFNDIKACEDYLLSEDMPMYLARIKPEVQAKRLYIFYLVGDCPVEEDIRVSYLLPSKALDEHKSMVLWWIAQSNL